MRLTKRFMDWYRETTIKRKETPAGWCKESWLCALELCRKTGCGEYAVSFMLYSNSDDSGCPGSFKSLSFGEFTG
ncbi:MAG: hypothetical protein ACLTUL_06635 [Blautia faecis]